MGSCGKSQIQNCYGQRKGVRHLRESEWQIVKFSVVFFWSFRQFAWLFHSASRWAEFSLFDSLVYSPPPANYNSIYSPRSYIHLLKQVKPPIKKQWTALGRISTENGSVVDCRMALWNINYLLVTRCRRLCSRSTAMKWHRCET